jgi:hypothetical protein
VLQEGQKQAWVVVDAVFGPRSGGWPPGVALQSFLRPEFIAGVMAAAALELGCAHLLRPKNFGFFLQNET